MARSLALLVVVCGHLILAVIDRDSAGQLRGDNVLALYPQFSWVTLVAPMPIFFAAGGWANATSTPLTSVKRLRVLVGLAAIVVTVWSAVSIIELLLLGESGTLSDGARLATQPLWFLTAYIPFAAYGQRISGVAQRLAPIVGLCLAVLVVIDIARFGFGADDKWGWPSFFLAWGIPWMIGAWWRKASQSPAFNERKIGAVLAISGAMSCVLLVKIAHYYPALIDAVPNERSNTTPPTVFTAVAAIAQAGVLMMIASSLDAIATRWRSTIDALSKASVAVYAWHLSALALVAGLLALGAYAPTRFSAAWWLTRPLWYASVIGVTALFVVATSFVQKHRHHRGAERALPQMFHVGVVLAVIGGGVIGLYGPRTLPGAVVASSSLLGSWWFLRARESTDQTANI